MLKPVSKPDINCIKSEQYNSVSFFKAVEKQAIMIWHSVALYDFNEKRFLKH